MSPPPQTATDLDASRLRRALELAEGGRGRVSPNPLVGAVVARGDEVLGEGFHAQLGGLHAEAAALQACREAGADAAGATMYVTMEPCAHQGRQPPCSDAIVAAGISRVVIGCDDPSAKASGRGPGILRDEGIDVAFAEGAEATAARRLNQPFRKHSRTGRPLVAHKAAISLDGRTATAAGDSKWISGEASREQVHGWRAESDAIAVGIGTALADDPTLTARDVGAARQPSRVVFDSQARLPLDSKLMTTVGEAPVIVIVSAAAPSARAQALSEAGAEVIPVAGEGAGAIAPALEELGRREITSLLLEGGATLAGSFLAAGEIDELRLFIAPVLLGGDARPLFDGPGAPSVDEALRALELEPAQSGADVLVRARIREW